MECDSRVDDNQCTRFTVYHLYAFAAKVPPSGAGVSLIRGLLLIYLLYVHFQGIYH